jgi:hypothetical protein
MPDDLIQQLIKLFKIDLFAFDARGMDTGSVHHAIAWWNSPNEADARIDLTVGT